MNKSDIIAKIKEFEEAIQNRKSATKIAKQIASLGENAINVIGQYFYEGGKSSDTDLWIYLFQEFHIKDYPIPSTEIRSWIEWSKKKYLDCREEYARQYKEVSEYIMQINFNNSSHRQTAVAKYQWLMKEAEKLCDEKKIEEIKKEIHSLQAG